jgi:hypothetical protein
MLARKKTGPVKTGPGNTGILIRPGISYQHPKQQLHQINPPHPIVFAADKMLS